MDSGMLRVGRRAVRIVRQITSFRSGIYRSKQGVREDHIYDYYTYAIWWDCAQCDEKHAGIGHEVNQARYPENNGNGVQEGVGRDI